MIGEVIILDTNEPSEWISGAEAKIAELLLPILNSVAVGENLTVSPELEYALGGLNFFIPQVLGEVHREWVYESLDGVYPAILPKKIGLRTVQIVGMCDIMSDQRSEPIFIELQVSPTGDRVNWLLCKLGGWTRLGVKSPGQVIRLCNSIYAQIDKINWTYIVTFGEKVD